MELLYHSLVGYLIGSVPFADWIRTRFLKPDSQNHNIEAEIFAFTLDMLKVTLSVFLGLAYSSHPWPAVCIGISAALGHCYPLFARFRGGTGVSSLFGFLLALWAFGGQSAGVFFFPLQFLLLLLFLTKNKAVSGVLSALEAILCVWAYGGHVSYIFAAAIFAMLILTRHRHYIQHLRSGTEYTVSWR